MYITIIEDEKLLSKNIAKRLKKQWFNSSIYDSYNNFINSEFIKPDLFIIDLSLWDWSWFDIINFIRNRKNLDTPIIITTAYNDLEKKLYGLNLWADDYLTKPYSIEELIARIKVVIRRTYKISNNSKLKYKNFVYNIDKQIIEKNNKEILLANKEISLVEFLLYNKWKIISKEDIIKTVWWEIDLLNVSDNNIMVVISNIRKKLWKDFNLQTIKNKWYILKEEK